MWFWLGWNLLPSVWEWYGPRLRQDYLGCACGCYPSVRRRQSVLCVAVWGRLLVSLLWGEEGLLRCTVCARVHVLNVAVELSSVVAWFRLLLRCCCRVWRAVLALCEREASHSSWWPGGAGRLANAVAGRFLGNGTAVKHTCGFVTDSTKVI